MKILVCVKVTNGEINPFDESALECALRLSQDVTVISMAPESARTVLLPLTRLGAKVILISDRIYAGSDTLATSYILFQAIKNMKYDLILCGKQSVDGDTAHVGPMLAQRLECNLVTGALSVEKSEEQLTVKTRHGSEKVTFPALISVERSYILRFPSIFSRLGDISIIDNSLINCEESRCGFNGSPTKVLRTFENSRGKRKCKFITMDELMPLIAELSHAEKTEEVKSVITQKISSVWAVGEEIFEKASEIADEVVIIEKTDAETIAKRAKREKPQVILWNADMWGRKTAPQTAALLETGLCADCTQLDVDDGELIMYRPAHGGSIYAKIKCLTKPIMATVRTGKESTGIIVAGGKGVSDKLDKLQLLASTLDAQIAASRGLVDIGKADYSIQVGLTGKTVSPKIYVAVGISGAVQHTVAIEDASYIIAINPDKDARIFEYADYGIICEF